MNANRQTISTETMLQLVADPRRRTVLSHIRERGETAVAIDELSGVIVPAGTGSSYGNATNAIPARRNDVELTRAELHHELLPTLDDAGIIEYDRREGTARYLAHDRVEVLLEFVSTRLE